MSGPTVPEGAPARRSAREWTDAYPVLAPPRSAAGAAVTLVLRDGLRGTELLLIERSRDPSDPASGDVALPGGRTDDADDTLAATAVRELEEEVGLSASDLTGPLHFVGVQRAPRFGLSVGVFAAELAPAARAATAHSPQEVAHVFWFPSERLPATDRIERSTPRGVREVPASRFEGHLLWGFTRRVVREFFGLPPESDVGGVEFAPPPPDPR